MKLTSLSSTPGPWSRTITVPSEQATSTTPPSGLHLRALSSRLSTARPMRADDPDTQVGATWASKTTPRLRPWVVATSTASRTIESSRIGSVVELGLFTPGQLGQVGHQGGQLVQLGEDVADQHLPFLGSELLQPAGHLHVGPQAGQRCAQLVGGVEHQLALALPRGVERGQQPIERPSQAAELVGAARVEALGHVGGLGQLLHRAGQLVERAEHRAPDREPEQDRHGDPHQHDQPQGEGQVAELLVDPGEWRGDLEGATARGTCQVPLLPR